MNKPKIDRQGLQLAQTSLTDTAFTASKLNEANFRYVNLIAINAD